MKLACACCRRPFVAKGNRVTCGTECSALHRRSQAKAYDRVYREAHRDNNNRRQAKWRAKNIEKNRARIGRCAQEISRDKFWLEVQRLQAALQEGSKP